MKKRGAGARTREELQRYVEEFEGIPQQVINNICNSMERRCEILIATGGGNVEHPEIDD